MGLADMLVAELAKACLHDPPSPWRERSNGVIKTNGVAGMSELSGRGKRKREASEEDAMDQDRCVTSTPTREVSEAVDDGYEADVSMTGAELQRLLGDPVSWKGPETNEWAGEADKAVRVFQLYERPNWRRVFVRAACCDTVGRRPGQTAAQIPSDARPAEGTRHV